MRTIYFENRKSGIALIGDLSWGSHFCHFYQTADDLVEILVPYFRAGLENNELCVWVTSRPLGVKGAAKALSESVPRFEEYAKGGRIEIVPSRRWPAVGEETGIAILAMLDKAISGGFDGLRLACNAVPERRGSKAFACSGADVAGRHNVISAFAYPRDKFDAAGLMEAVKSHRFALVRNADRWELLKSSEAEIVIDALKRSEEKLNSLFSNMSEGFAYHRIVLDSEGKPCDYVFLEVNEAFERLTGLTAAAVIGMRATEALPGIDRDPTDWIGRYGEVALTGRPTQFESHSELLGKWYEVSAFCPHKGYFAVTFSDISERKLMDEELRRANDDLEARVRERTAELSTTVARLELMNQELREFAFVASHDLQEPLRKIQTYCDLTKKRCASALDRTAQDYLARVENSASRMRQLLLDLLQFSRVATRPGPFKQIELGELAREAADVFEETVRKTGGLVEIENLPRIEADESQMIRLFQNLVGNALKFRGGESPHIRISAGPEGDGVCEIFVRDNGIGFEQQFAERIFKPFQRLHNRNEYEGTGIGLAICRKIAERHGGSIRAESEPGKGSTFIVRLPVKQERWDLT